ncbi:hypothetical protein N8D56_05070 [Devosia sp. A8/3-2]|nr:hypothetical protein N8D56_05070 [Devosia sp. A8/3-2]
MRALVVFCPALMAAPALADTGIPSYGEGAAENITDRELIERWAAADEVCRGTYGSDIGMWEACGLREAYNVLLKGRKYCVYGPTVTNGWERCKE